ncbi:solute carrier family 23 member 2-like [Pocillopora damicornis]|uniref:solute carrier family 23 member 2-like n=1 Tax=Pocillopora damicornis TaxID=46731 RepID=UPI000F550D5C|nr:solute carrier family 23 member 2-like [Pocillopora damicornis]XP_058955391.1 solute carrier family 23 member 2-like [Pocillopora verrucosa]
MSGEEIQTSKPDAEKKRRAFGLTYLIDENPPWYICLLLGFQHYLTMLGGTLSIPFILSGPMCFGSNTLAISEVLSTILFVSGVVTLLQSTFGVRLPIIQGGAFSFLTPTFAILSLPQWTCPKPEEYSNSTLEMSEIWKPRMREIQGAIMVSSLFQMLVGFTGIVGFLLRFIGPLTIAPTITLVGLALFNVAAEHAGNHWGISMTTIVLIALFSQYLTKIKIPFPGYSKERRECYVGHYPLFRLFPVILAIAVSWIICAIITASGGFPSDPSVPQYMARTDARTVVLREAKWFRFPYPGQWGTPSVSAAGVFGMLAGVLASIIESVGDYYACARLAGAPPPPKHAVNRGIGMEGMGCLLAGAFGTGNGTTSYSENVGAIGITKVGSLRVIQFGALVLMVVGVLGKFGALFVCIPDPIVGGVFMVMFGMITAVGISNLQFADMNSSRNLFIVGFSTVFGLGLPYYMKNHENAISTGVPEIDQIITVLFKTSMAVGCISALILDNTIPGTDEERGIKAWREHLSDESEGQMETASIKVYDLPFGLNRVTNFKVAKYLPFLPNHEEEQQVAYDVEMNSVS